MIIADGASWLTAEEAVAELGSDITPGMIRDWRRRGLVRAHLIRQGRSAVAYHHRDDLVSAERQTRQRGRARTTVDRTWTDDLPSEAISS